MPIPDPVWGPYGKVADGARYNVINPQLERDGVVAHTYESVGDTLSLARVRATLATPGERDVTAKDGRHYGVAYHAFPSFPEGAPGEYFEVLDEHHNPNAAGAIPNRRMLHFCLWGRASQTREQWLDAKSYPQLQALAHFLFDKSKIHKFPMRHLECVGKTWTQTKQQKKNAAIAKAAGKIGALGHRDVTAVWDNMQGHGDPGINFPWDVVMDLAWGYQVSDWSATDLAGHVTFWNWGTLEAGQKILGVPITGLWDQPTRTAYAHVLAWLAGLGA